MTPWKDLACQQDLDELLDLYGYFHDSCLVSARCETGARVDETGAMHFGTAPRHTATLVFHSQWQPRVLELRFTGVRRLHLTGWQQQYENLMLDGHLALYEDLLPGGTAPLIVWADHEDFSPLHPEAPLREPAESYVIADAAQWRTDA